MSAVLRILVLGPQEAKTPADDAGVQYHRCADLPDLMGRAGAGAADGALLSPLVAGVDALVVSQLRARGCRAVGWVAGATQTELARRSGLAECVADPVDADVLRSVLTAPQPASTVGPAVGAGRVIAVWGPPGSPGRSTIAALLAVGAQRAGESVLMIDADLAAPQWQLLIEPQQRPAGLIVAARRAASGSADIADLLLPIADSIALLPGVAEPERWLEVAPGSAAAVLGAAAATAQTVIIDLPSDIRPAHPAYDLGWAHDAAAFPRALLALADVVVPVLAAEPLGVHRFASWWPILRNQAEPRAVVANGVGHPLGGGRPDEQLAAVLAALGIASPAVRIPWQPKAAGALLGHGWADARGWRRAPEDLWQVIGRGWQEAA